MLTYTGGRNWVPDNKHLQKTELWVTESWLYVKAWKCYTNGDATYEGYFSNKDIFFYLK